MRLTLITPTQDRADYLRFLYGNILAQEHKDWEWRIYDTSIFPDRFFEELDDPRVHYHYDEERKSVGAKRNWLLERMEGEAAVHLDDDDCYGTGYLAGVTRMLEKHPFCKSVGWLIFDSKTGEYYYWGSVNRGEPAFFLSALEKEALVMTPKDPETMVRGYGFSYAYRREVVEAVSFPEINFAEDLKFYERVAAAGFSIHHYRDEKGWLVQGLHSMNFSKTFAPYRLPTFIVERLFPELHKRMQEYPHEDRHLGL